MTLVAAGVTPGFYLVLLVLTRELGRADLEVMMQVHDRPLFYDRAGRD